MLTVPKPVWWVGGAVVLLGAIMVLSRRTARPMAVGVEADSALARLPPLPRRVTVEVLNASGVDGFARVGMARLRRAGLDVVSTGNASAAQREAGATLVLVRRGDTTGVGRVRLTYPMATVRDDPSATPLVDLTVVLGHDAATKGNR